MASDEALVATIKFLRICGMWSTPADGVLYRTYWAVLCLCQAQFVLVLILCLFWRWEDMVSLMDNMAYTFSQLPTAVIIASLLGCSSRYHHVVSSIRKLVLLGSPEDDEVKDAVQTFLRQERSIMVVYPLVVLSGYVSSICKPNIQKLLTSAGDNSTLAANTVPLLLHPALEMSDYGVFVATYSYVSVSLLLTWPPLTSLDVLAFNLVLGVTCQFRVLSVRLKKLGAAQPHCRRDHTRRAEVLQATQHHHLCADSIAQDNSFTKQHNQSRVILYQLISDHQEVLSNAENLSELLSYNNFTHYAVSSALICLLLFMTTLVKDKALLMVKCFHLSAILTRIFIICYLSTELTEQSLAVRDAAYFSDWQGLDGELKSALVMVLARAQRPVNVKAGSFAVMSLPMYLTLIQCAYSYYNILNTLELA